MDIVEYTEKVLDVKLTEWQKDHLRKLDELRPSEGVHVIMRRHNGIYIYRDQTHKELT